MAAGQRYAATSEIGRYRRPARLMRRISNKTCHRDPITLVAVLVDARRNRNRAIFGKIADQTAPAQFYKNVRARAKGKADHDKKENDDA